MSEYLPVLLMMAAGIAVGVGALTLSHLIGPKIGNKIKDSPFECGVPALGSTQQRVSVRFYLVAILFLLFDVEAVFFFPWAIVFKDYLSISNFIMIEMAVFIGILLIGYVYILRKGALEWD